MLRNAKHGRHVTAVWMVLDDSVNFEPIREKRVQVCCSGVRRSRPMPIVKFGLPKVPTPENYVSRG